MTRGLLVEGVLSQLFSTAFNKLSGDSVVWLRRDKAWVPRQEHHYPGRQQD